MSEKDTITILLVDDIPEARENIKKLLAFEQDMKVVGTAGTGREGVDLAKELKPDIIIMDINMPDMDGLQATNLINKSVPTAAVIIMSVQDDTDYMRRAMLAGARDFLPKPIDMDELYNTIRTVYRNHEAIRLQAARNAMTPADALRASEKSVDGDRLGCIIVVYSPQGGAGTTTIATNLATGLLREGTKVLLVDADLQFGDVDTFLNIQTPTTIVDLIDDVEDFDVDHFDNVVATHETGLKVLVGPQRPEFADEVKVRPDSPARILETVANNYDFIIVDTASVMDEVLLSLFDVATKILLVMTPSLSSTKNIRFVLDLFDKLEYDPNKSMIVSNKVYDERNRKQATLGKDRIENFLKRKLEYEFPVVDERIILNAIMRGVPVINSDRDQSKPPIKGFVEFSNKIHKQFMGDDEPDEEPQEQSKKGGFLRLGR